MNKPSKVDQIHALCEALFGERPRNYLSEQSPFLDISRTNFHDSKKEFLQELATVEAIIAHSEAIFDNIVQQGDAASAEHKKMVERLQPALDQYAMQQASKRWAASAGELAVQNVLSTGFYYNSVMILIHLADFYRRHLIELKRQEAEFWSFSHRAPKYYARTIALRFARLFATERGIKPTKGTVSDGNHPSTGYGRALEQVFAILGIKSNVRTAGEWAISQLTEHDWNPPANSLAVGLMGFTADKAANGTSDGGGLSEKTPKKGL